MKGKILVSLTLVVVMFVASTVLAEPTPSGQTFASVMEKCQDSIVNVSYVLTVKMSRGQGSDSDQSKAETTGVVINDDGLILINNTEVSGGVWAAMMKQFQQEVDIRSSDFKVILPDGTELPAKLLVRDSNNDIAFLKITDFKGQTLKAVTIDSSKKIGVGDEVVGVTRYGRSLHFAPRFHSYYINARLDAPRLMYDIDGQTAQPGMAIFDKEGVFLGVFASIPELATTLEEAGANQMRSQMMEAFGVYLLPYKDITSAIKRIPKEETKEENKDEVETEKKED